MSAQTASFLTIKKIDDPTYAGTGPNHENTIYLDAENHQLFFDNELLYKNGFTAAELSGSTIVFTREDGSVLNVDLSGLFTSVFTLRGILAAEGDIPSNPSNGDVYKFNFSYTSDGVTQPARSMWAYIVTGNVGAWTPFSQEQNLQVDDRGNITINAERYADNTINGQRSIILSSRNHIYGGNAIIIDTEQYGTNNSFGRGNVILSSNNMDIGVAEGEEDTNLSDGNISVCDYNGEIHGNHNISMQNQNGDITGNYNVVVGTRDFSGNAIMSQYGSQQGNMVIGSGNTVNSGTDNTVRGNDNTVGDTEGCTSCVVFGNNNELNDCTNVAILGCNNIVRDGASDMVIVNKLQSTNIANGPNDSYRYVLVNMPDGTIAKSNKPITDLFDNFDYIGNEIDRIDGEISDINGDIANINGNLADLKQSIVRTGLQYVGFVESSPTSSVMIDLWNVTKDGSTFKSILQQKMTSLGQYMDLSNKQCCLKITLQQIEYPSRSGTYNGVVFLYHEINNQFVAFAGYQLANSSLISPASSYLLHDISANDVIQGNLPEIQIGYTKTSTAGQIDPRMMAGVEIEIL